MGLRILAGTRINDGNYPAAVLYCSTSMTALPFLFHSKEDAENFLRIYGDIRNLSAGQQHARFEEFRNYPAGNGPLAMGLA